MRPATPVATESLCAAIGRTPLVRVRGLSKETGCGIFAKAEFMNPGGSAKDRVALALIEDARRSGALRSGGVIVEATAGNTGAGLAWIGRALGHRCLLVVPDGVSQGKVDHLLALGAEVRQVPDRAADHPGNYVAEARRLAESLPGGWWANQFDNPANREAHRLGTGPEIWTQTKGRVTDFVASVGTGGTLAGVGLALKERDPSIRVHCAEPAGAVVWSWVKDGRVESTPGSSIVEGIGQSRITANLAALKPDDAHLITDEEAVLMLQRVLREEGLFLGLSSAFNLCAARRVALEAGPGRVIVTVLCDGGGRYLQTVHNPAWLRAHGLPAGEAA